MGDTRTGRTVDLDGRVDELGVRYIGDAVEHEDGSWTCLADVRGKLCRVAVKIRFEDPHPA